MATGITDHHQASRNCWTIGVWAALAVLVTIVVTSASQAMTVKLQTSSDGKPVLLLSGTIASGDFQSIAARLKVRDFREVWLNSGGGDVQTGYKIGREIRGLGLVTRVPKNARCASACVDVYIGGVIRFADPGSEIIVHPGSISGGELAENMENWVKAGETVRGIQLFEQSATHEAASWARYLTIMGVSIDLVGFAAQVPHACYIVMRRSELIYFNVVNTAGPPPGSYTLMAPQKRC